MNRALFRRFPEIAERTPHRTIGDFPTPVERYRAMVPRNAELWVKRDDACNALYGGNKVRKLEFLLAAARAADAERLVTVGGWGSHHVLATALHGREAGFSTEAIVFPQPVTDHVREVLLADLACGATLIPTAGYLGAGAAIARRRWRKGSYWIAPGGSSPTGTLGWVDAGLEIAEQVARGELPAPDVVYAALGSAGTVAGLHLGLRLGGISPRLVGVRVVDRVVANRRAVISLARKTYALLASLGAKLPALPDLRRGLSIDHRFFGGAYGAVTKVGQNAVEIAAEGGIKLETTYTGKAFAALLSDAASRRLDRMRALFVCTYSSVDLKGLIERSPGVEGLPARLRGLFGN